MYNDLLETFNMQRGIEILGPEFPLISRIRNEYMKDILVKISPSEVYIHQTKVLIKRLETTFQSISDFRPIKVSYIVE